MDKLRTALDRFALAEKAYREKYGEESLDRVIYCDPLNISAEETNRAAKTLEMAVAKKQAVGANTRRVLGTAYFLIRERRKLFNTALTIVGIFFVSFYGEYNCLVQMTY